MFDGDPKARADLKPGTFYAVTGEDGWIYYGQVAPNKAIGFFRFRAPEFLQPQAVLTHPLMAVVAVAYPSITRALRAGDWTKLGRYPLSDDLAEPRLVVQWSVMTTRVKAWSGDAPKFECRVEDPAIQEAEVMAVWDAQHGIPERLTADFSPDEAAWHVGGPIWRERRVREEYARRFADVPFHQLPSDWVPTEAR